MSWDTDGDRQKEGTLQDFEVALGCLVCLGALRILDDSGKMLFNFSLNGLPLVEVINNQVYAATFDKLSAIEEAQNVLYLRHEDFDQGINAIISDTNPYAWVAFEDGFIRAYNNTPLRTRAGYVNGEGIAYLSLTYAGDVISVGSNDNGGFVQSWQNDLIDQNWRLDGLSGAPVSCFVEFFTQEIFVAFQGTNKIEVYDTAGNAVRAISLDGTPTSMDANGRFVYVYEGGGWLEKLDFSGNQIMREQFIEKGGQGIIAVAPRESLKRSIYEPLSNDPAPIYVASIEQGIVRKIRDDTLEVVWTAEHPVYSMASWAGPQNEKVWERFFIAEHGPEFDFAEITASLPGGEYYLVVIILGYEHRDTADVTAALQGGLYYPVVITHDYEHRDTVDVTSSLQGGLYYLVVIVHDYEHRDTADVTSSLQGGNYSLVVIVMDYEHRETADVTASLQGGSYNAV